MAKKRKRSSSPREPKSLKAVISREFMAAWAVLDELMAGLATEARLVIAETYRTCMTTPPPAGKSAVDCLREAAEKAGIGGKFKAVWLKYLADGRTEYGIRWAKYPEVKTGLRGLVAPLIAEVYRTCIHAVGAESAAACYKRVALEKALGKALEDYWKKDQPATVLEKAGIA